MKITYQSSKKIIFYYSRTGSVAFTVAGDFPFASLGFFINKEQIRATTEIPEIK